MYVYMCMHVHTGMYRRILKHVCVCICVTVVIVHGMMTSSPCGFEEGVSNMLHNLYIYDICVFHSNQIET